MHTRLQAQPAMGNYSRASRSFGISLEKKRLVFTFERDSQLGIV